MNTHLDAALYIQCSSDTVLSEDGLKVWISVNSAIDVVYSRVTSPLPCLTLLFGIKADTWNAENMTVTMVIIQKKHIQYRTLTSAPTNMVIKTILFIDFSVQLICTNKVPFRVNILHQTLEPITILCSTIVHLNFNQCKLHVTNKLRNIFALAPAYHY